MSTEPTDHFVLDVDGEPVAATRDEWKWYIKTHVVERVLARTDVNEFMVTTMFFGQPDRVWELRVGKFVPHDVELIKTTRGPREQAEALHMEGVQFALGKFGLQAIPFEMVFPPGK